MALIVTGLPGAKSGFPLTNKTVHAFFDRLNPAYGATPRAVRVDAAKW
jgi:hypothetical protein